MKKSSRGFTLIELLVVIAIIGILSAIVLASLSTARNKGKGASIQGSMSSMRAQAELTVGSNGTYPANLCSAGLLTLEAAVNATGGTSLTCGILSTGGGWGAAVTLPDNTYYCVDSAGYAGSSNVAPGTEIANNADVVCDNT